MSTGEVKYEHSLYSGYIGSSGVYIYSLVRKNNSDIDFIASVLEDPNTYASPNDYQIQTIKTLNLANSATATAYKCQNGYFETGLFTLGEKANPAVLKIFEIELARKMVTGESISIYFRNNLTDSYVLVGTMSFATDGAVASKTINNEVKGDQVQFKVTITSAGFSTTGVYLKAIYIS
jgi:hypothetical protein